MYLQEIIGKTISNLYEWRQLDTRQSARQGYRGGVYLRLDNEQVIGVPHFVGTLQPDFIISRQLDERARSVFYKRRKIFRVKTPLAKRLQGHAIISVHLGKHRGYYVLANGYVLSENLPLPHGRHAAGLVLFDSLKQVQLLEGTVKPF